MHGLLADAEHRRDCRPRVAIEPGTANGHGLPALNVSPIPGHGRYMRQPLYNRDFCRVILHCVEHRPVGATYDIVIDAYRIETLKPEQLGIGSGMSQYGWRIGSAGAGALALYLAARYGWEAAYLACALFALPAVVAALWLGEPDRHRDPTQRKGGGAIFQSIIGPFVEFFQRQGALLVLLFVLVHKNKKNKK